MTKEGMSDYPIVNFSCNKVTPVHQPASLKTESLELMTIFEIDVHMMANIMLFLPNSVLSDPKIGTFTYHLPILPMYRGSSSIN